MTTQPKIWWVKDFLSGECLENRYYSTQEEAVAARTRLGYGMVASWEVLPDGQYYEETASGKKRVFSD